MVRTLRTSDAAFSADLAALIAPGESEDVRATVAAILADVRRRGFGALADQTLRFDGFALTAGNVRVGADDIAGARAACDAETVAALEFAAGRVRAYHEKQLPADHRYTDEAGVELGWRWTPVACAGLYAPGGRAAYPSSVLMNAIPARVAGVPRIVLCVPAPKGELSPLILAAAAIAGVDEIFRIGGAQAIAAMAYGAGPVPRVDVIAGPGNAYVAEAKRQVFGAVGIDSIAGPSEILVVADAVNDPQWIAADLLSQAEHDPSSRAILIADDEGFARRVAEAVAQQLAQSPRREIAEAAWRDNSAIVIVRSFNEAPALIDRIAPEHLELAVADPDALAARIRNAGAIFLGRHAPEAVGDYVAGPNHVLPTAGTARFASGLSPLAFMKRTSIIGCGPEALAKIGPAAATLADAEGLPGHAESIRRRM